MAGGAAGAVLRYWLVARIRGRVVGVFPWGTLVVNTIGAFAIGVLWALMGSGAPGSLLWLLLAVGLLGSFTTVSSWALDSLHLQRQKRGVLALANIFLTLVLCLAAVAAGYGLVAGTAHGG